MEFNFNVGKTLALSEVSDVLGNLSEALKWIFFIVMAFEVLDIFKYIKKKNASPTKNKHSRNTK